MVRDRSTEDEFTGRFHEERHRIGRANIAVVGKTGSGKSTLINAVFGAVVAAADVGRPQTAETTLHVNPTGTLGIYDFPGLESGSSSRALKRTLARFVKDNRAGPALEHLHVVWFCIRSGRYDDGEIEVIEHLASIGLRVVVVITQAAVRGGVASSDDERFHRSLTDLDLPVSAVCLTSAVANDFTGDELFGLVELLDATFRVAPDAQQDALGAAQRVDFVRKRAAARAATAAAATLAAGAGAVPLPGSDAAVLVPTQLALMSRIAVIYDLRLDRSAAAGLAVTTLATQTGRLAVSSLLKLVPGAGSAISASVAAAFTYAIGEAWLLLCERIATGDLPADVLTSRSEMSKIITAQVTALMRSQLQARKRNAGRD